MIAPQYIAMPVLATPYGYVPMGPMPPAAYPPAGLMNQESALDPQMPEVPMSPTSPQSPASGVMLESLLPGGSRTARAPNVRKVFVGGLNPNTDAKRLREYFSQFGTVVDSSVITDVESNTSRGFGFVQFEDELPPGLLTRQHVIDHRRCGVRGYGQNTRNDA
jgi:hypothetical protein